MKAKYKVVSFGIFDPARQDKDNCLKRDVRVRLVMGGTSIPKQQVSLLTRDGTSWRSIATIYYPEITFEGAYNNEEQTILIKGLFWVCGPSETAIYQQGFIRLTP